MTEKKTFLEIIKNQIIVSCQAVDDEPLNDIRAISLMAKAVIEGGATVLRLSQEEHIKEIKKLTKFPIIGLIKQKYLGSEVYITPTKKEIDTLINLDISCIALDATSRKRPNDETFEELVRYIRKKSPKTLIMADCSNIDDVINAEKNGVDVIGTTLRGYTEDTKGRTNIENNFSFIRECLEKVKTPIIAEGGFWEHEDIYNVLKVGAHSIVVGSAITRPKDITHRYLTKLKERMEND